MLAKIYHKIYSLSRNSVLIPYRRSLVSIAVIMSLFSAMALMSACSISNPTNTNIAGDGTATSNTDEQQYSDGKTYYQFLGNEYYDVPISAMVMEPIEGETFPGIIYREVLDLDGLSLQTEIPVCLYFYTSSSNNYNGVTAGVEDLAEEFDGRVLFVSVDAMQCQEVVYAYEIGFLPEFVLLNDGYQISTFNGSQYSTWSTSVEVYDWLLANGI